MPGDIRGEEALPLGLSGDPLPLGVGRRGQDLGTLAAEETGMSPRHLSCGESVLQIHNVETLSPETSLGLCLERVFKEN